MANQQAKRDDNRVPALLIHNSTGAETRQVRSTAANPNALPVEVVTQSGAATSGSFDHGSNRDVDTAAGALTATSFSATKGVTVIADSTNTGIIYVGNSDVTAGTTAATDGFPIQAGESVTLEVNNPNLLYVIASVNNQIVYWVAV